MSQEERETLIKYIKANDHSYSYTGVNFKYYSNADLRTLKKKIDLEKRRSASHKGDIMPSAA